MKKFISTLFLLFSLWNLSGLDTISLSVKIINPDNRENRDLVSGLLFRSASRASRMYNKYIQVEKGIKSADYTLELMAILNDENPVLVAEFTEKSTGKALTQSLPGHITEDSHRFLSEVIFKLWTELNPEKITQSAPMPQFIEEIPSRYLTEAAAPGYAGYSTASAVAVKENGNIILAMGALCYELNNDFNVVSQIGGDIFNRTSSLFAFGAAVTPGGTVYLKPANGRELFRIVEGANRTIRVRAGIDVNGPMAVLNNGITILYHTTSRKFVRIDGTKRSEIDLNLGPYTYVYAMAAGPEGNLWIHDSIEQRFKIYTDEGVFINSIIPVGLGEDILSPMAMTISENGNILLYSNSALYKFSKEGFLIWKMEGYYFRQNETFPITPVNLAVDSDRGFIYMADYAAARVLKFYDPGQNSAAADNKTETVLRLNEKISSAPDSSDFIWEKIDFYLQQESWVLAKMWLEEIININPFDTRADALLAEMELRSLLNQVDLYREETLELIDKLGPETARQKYSRTVQLYEKILSLNPGNQKIITDLNKFRETFNREASIPGSQQKPLTIASIDLENIFPSLINFYLNNPIGSVHIKNELDAPVRNIRAELNLRQFIDYPEESEPVEILEPGEEIGIDLNIHLNEKAFNIQEDLPLLAQVNVIYELNGEVHRVSKTTGSTLYRRTALSWDNTAKLAAFIMPNEGIVSAFSHRVLDLNPDGDGLPPKMVKAVRICDALGVYGISYVEDPESPFSQILGKEQYVDTVRYPRTTLNIQSGDCDDTTALLASLLESAGIKTAIMTSPGHVFPAFDSGEPTANKWMFEIEGFSVIEHEGTLWIPLESTVLSEGFNNAWFIASSIIDRNRAADIEFVPVEDQRKLFPPLPLRESNMIVVEPVSEQIEPLYRNSIKSLKESLYESGILSLKEEISGAGTRKQRQLSNKLGILHARFNEFTKAEITFKNLIEEDSNYLSPYLNLGNLYYYNGDYDKALETFKEAEKLKPDSVMVNLALAKTHHKLNDFFNTERYYEIVRNRSESLSDKYAYLVKSSETTRAGIDEEPPISWDADE